MKSDRKGEQAPHTCLLVLSHVIVSSDNPPVMFFLYSFYYLTTLALTCWRVVLVPGVWYSTSSCCVGKLRLENNIKVNARIQSLQRLRVYRRIILLQRIITIIFHGVQHTRPSCFFHIALTPLDSAVQLFLFFIFLILAHFPLWCPNLHNMETASDFTLQTKVNIWKAQTRFHFSER